ncbi:hypothetical protein M569_15830 [Genlisea aurea]|uniref:Uncharacterized protein n=1 Tax=Genlisea aurea TaxID=192259 RepID=S8DHX6_9LAMI|nr:hypothetical protein M569_15830 [Genlisea aurea]
MLVRLSPIEINTSEKFRFTAELIEMRRQALDIFVASHNELSKSDDLRILGTRSRGLRFVAPSRAAGEPLETKAKKQPRF